MTPHRIAFVKHGGLNAGGTERWLQLMAANLNPKLFQIDYFYSSLGQPQEAGRQRYLEDHGIRLIRFNVGTRDLNTPTGLWRDTDFWDVFKEENYDWIQTAKAGRAEYPYCLMKKPVIEYRTLAGLADPSPNTVRSIHLSQWQRTEWFLRGGDLARSAVIPIPAEPPASNHHLRKELNIPIEAIVAGFHQRVDDAIYSPIPLAAFSRVHKDADYFVMMGGSERYRRQAQDLKLANVRFVPHSSDAVAISNFLNTLDIFAHGRKDGETFGTVFAEAMMHGKPCLSHKTQWANGQQETMGPAGFFANDETDYAEKLNILYTTPGIRRRLAENAKPHAQTYFSVQAAVKELEAIYLSLIDRQAQCAPRLSYGISPLGFLYYGELEKPGSVAGHVVTRQIPEPFGLYLAAHLKRSIQSVIDAPGAGGLYGFSVLKEYPDSKVIFLTASADDSAFLQETARLNRWEERCTFITTWDHFLEGKQNKTDLIILSGAALHALLKTNAWPSTNPILLIRELASADDLLALNGYSFWQCFEAGRVSAFTPPSIPGGAEMILALHQDIHSQEIASLVRLARRYRWYKIFTHVRKAGYLFLKTLRHPRRAMEGFRRYRQQPRYGWRF